MKETIRYGLILALICVVASGLLAGVNTITTSKILAQSKLEEEAVLRKVFADAARFESVKSANEIIYYKAYDNDGRFLGVAFKASGKGYSSTIETMVGMLKDGTIAAVSILSQNDTPGLGLRVTESSFTGRFTNKNITDLNQVQAITGATISSRAVIDSVKKKAEEIRSLIKDF